VAKLRIILSAYINATRAARRGERKISRAMGAPFRLSVGANGSPPRAGFISPQRSARVRNLDLVTAPQRPASIIECGDRDVFFHGPRKNFRPRPEFAAGERHRANIFPSAAKRPPLSPRGPWFPPWGHRSPPRGRRLSPRGLRLSGTCSCLSPRGQARPPRGSS